eukprot:COSAG02_NODE_5969_length_3902_cov_3.156455_6_plen_99_part_00
MLCVFVLLVLTCCSRAKALEIVPTRLIFAVLLVQVEARRKKKEAEKAASASDGKRQRRQKAAAQHAGAAAVGDAKLNDSVHVPSRWMLSTMAPGPYCT